MYKIVSKKVLNSVTKMLVVRAPGIAKVCRPGQFVMVRANETGERIPLTIADFSRERGLITIVFQKLARARDFSEVSREESTFRILSGLLGSPRLQTRKYGTVVAIGGGCGSAIVYPVARAFKEAGNYLITINGARTMELLLYKKQMREISDEFYVTTDDGSCGVHDS